MVIHMQKFVILSGDDELNMHGSVSCV